MPDVHVSYLGETEKETHSPAPIESGKVRWRIVTTFLPLACLAAASCAPGQTTTFSPDRQARMKVPFRSSWQPATPQGSLWP